MTPSNGTTGKTGQAMPRRPVGGLHKPVVPAIPLAYLPQQRRKPAQAPAPAPAPAIQPTPVEELTHDEPLVATPTSTVTQSGSSTIDAEMMDKITDEPAVSPTVLPDTQPQSTEAEKIVTLTSAADAAAPASGRLATPPSNEPSKQGADTPVARTSAVQAEQSVASPTPTRPRPGPSFDAVNGSQPRRYPPPGTDVFMEPFHPYHSREPSMKYNNTGLHQARASDGSLIFGALDSNTTSPVPLGGGAQPTTSMPYVPAVTAVAPALDGFGRPLIASPAFEGFPPDAFPQPGFHPTHNHHGPPTPHSFHGSQASVHADENGYPTYPPANGQTAYPGQPGGQAQRHMHTMSMNPQSGVHHSLSSGPMFSQLQAGTLQFLQSIAENAEFSDCTLELRLSTPVNQPGNRDAPLLVPCHRFILARSPILSEMLRSRSIPAGGRLVLEPERDEFMRPDSFHFSLRTLYGWDLPEYPSGLLPSYHPQHSMKESFDITLGYLAAAKYLKLPYVYAKAMPHACHQLHWETIEKACQFALPSVVLARPQSPRHKMGADSFIPSALVEAIVAFLVHEMPTDFVLDTNAGRCGFDRLPPSGPYEPRHAGPVVANGTSGHQIPESRGQPAAHANMPRHPRVSGNSRLSSIQFGDLSLENGAHNMPNGHGQRQRQPSDMHTTLSRILLNLPFFMLKKILEHPGLAKPSGGLDPQTRVSLISAVITEREARRFSVLNSGAPEFQVYVHRLETAHEPLVVQQIGDFYVNSLGFKEEVFSGEGPYIVQTWINGSGRANS